MALFSLHERIPFRPSHLSTKINCAAKGGRLHLRREVFFLGLGGSAKASAGSFRHRSLDVQLKLNEFILLISQ